MKILHISDEGLPDWRVEKSAMSASKVGYEVMFAGKKPYNYDRNTFSKLFEINWTPKARYGIPYYWHRVKKQFRNVLNEARPDVVHAHNLFSATMMSDLGIPYVYDDHEYWAVYARTQAESQEKSKQEKCIDDNLNGNSTSHNGYMDCNKILFRNSIRKVARSLLRSHKVRLWTKWEKDIVNSHPTITVSDKIASELKEMGHNKQVFVVPNYPLCGEMDGGKNPSYHHTLSSVYAGVEPTNGITVAQRNIEGLVQAFNKSDLGRLVLIGPQGNSSKSATYTGFLPRKAMYNEMFKHSIGLLPWKKHWSHYYVNPNKVYEYAHAGLFVMCTSSFATVTETMKGNCATFEDYDDMALQLAFYKENMDELYRRRLEIFRFARNELVWETVEKNILRAYQLC